MKHSVLSLMVTVFLLLALIMTFDVPPRALSPSGTSTIQIYPNILEFGPSPAVGTHFVVSCWICGVTDLYGVDIQIGWDTAWIQYVSHQKTIPVEMYPGGILHSPTIAVKDQVDETASMAGSAPGTMYWLAEASVVPATPFAGYGLAFTMTFRVKQQSDIADVQVPLRFTALTLTNSLGDPITQVEVHDGSVRIPRLIREASIVGFLASKNVTSNDQTVYLNISFANLGSPETLNFTVYANETMVTGIILPSFPGTYSSVVIPWNCTNWIKGWYVIEAVLSPLLNENNTTNNMMQLNEKIILTITGDIDGNFDVNILDVVKIVAAYGTTPSDPEWNRNADIFKPYGKIDILDLVACTKQYGQKWP